MLLSISATFNLPNTLTETQEAALEELTFVDRVVNDHTCWLTADFETDDFDVARSDAAALAQQIAEVLARRDTRKDNVEQQAGYEAFKAGLPMRYPKEYTFGGMRASCWMTGWKDAQKDRGE